MAQMSASATTFAGSVIAMGTKSRAIQSPAVTAEQPMIGQSMCSYFPLVEKVEIQKPAASAGALGVAGGG